MRAPAHHRRAGAWLRAAGIAVERTRYPRPEAGGETAAVRLLPAAEPVGRVVAAHGAGNDALFPLVAVFAALVRRGFEVFSVDLDGNGWESTTRFHPDTAAGAVAAAVEAAERDRPPLPMHLLGHSLGGALSLAFLATAEGARLASATLMSAPLEVRLGPRVALGELAGFFSRAALGQRATYGLWGTVPAVGPLKRRAYPFRHALEGRPLAYIDAVRELLRALELERAAARVRVPTLLVYGTADHLTPPAQGERLAALIPGAELCLVPRASHFTVPFAPEAIERVVRWVERWTPPPPASLGGRSADLSQRSASPAVASESTSPDGGRTDVSSADAGFDSPPTAAVERRR